MNKTLSFVSVAGFLLFGIGCGDSSSSDEGDASISHDAKPGSDGPSTMGGSPGTGGSMSGSGGMVAVDGPAATGGMMGTGGAMGSGGLLALDGGLGTGGMTGSGGHAMDGGSAIDTGAGLDAATDIVCGGIAALPCPTGQFCEFASGVCSSIADGTGICALRSEICPAIYQPVCGCDGKTYGNDCERRGAGVSKLTDGECGSPGKMCGGIAGIACAKSQFCDLAPGDCGTIADGAGTCAATGTGIACDKIYKPVCGCDGTTYGNDCERQVAGVSKRADGACPSLDAGSHG